MPGPGLPPLPGRGHRGRGAVLTGRFVVVLTVGDVERSAAWYATLLGMDERGRYVRPDGRLGQACLAEPRSGLEICLVSHASNPADRFSEFRTGLDHLEFLVPDREDLDVWARRLDALEIDHSGVKQPAYSANAMITFRDPDNIQLEFFWQAPPS